MDPIAQLWRCLNCPSDMAVQIQPAPDRWELWAVKPDSGTRLRLGQVPMGHEAFLDPIDWLKVRRSLALLEAVGPPSG